MKVVMGLIMEGGNAKAFAIEAINAAKKNDFIEADKQIKKSEEALGNAHSVQTSMLTKEAQGEHTDVNLYMVHAQDWLMTGITFKDLAKEMVEIYKNLNQKNK